MAQILVRNIEPDVVAKLKRRAKQHGRSLQNEARQILTQSAGFHPENARKLAKQWHKKLSGRRFPDTTKLVRQDRDR
jgi:plasmid stability protein